MQKWKLVFPRLLCVVYLKQKKETVTVARDEDRKRMCTGEAPAVEVALIKCNDNTQPRKAPLSGPLVKEKLYLILKVNLMQLFVLWSYMYAISTKMQIRWQLETNKLKLKRWSDHPQQMWSL